MPSLPEDISARSTVEFHDLLMSELLDFVLAVVLASILVGVELVA